MRRKMNGYLLAGLILTGFMAALILTGLVWTPYDPDALMAGPKLEGPSLAHWLGTDSFGRDIFSRVLRGAGTTFLIAVSTVAVGAVCGTAVGACTGYFGGLVDEALMRFNDAMTAFPSILLALVLISILGPGNKYNVVIALGLVFIPSFARVTRSAFAALRDVNYVKSARLMGASSGRILVRQILPNTMQVLLPAITIGFNNAVLAEASMSYLGIGVTPPDASLGYMLSEAQGMLTSAPWYALGTGGAIVLLIFGVGLIGEGLQRRGRGGVLMLEIQDLHVKFHTRQREAVAGVSLTIRDGEILGLVGESGSGKSVTAMSVAGLLPRKQCDFSGQILLDGVELLHADRSLLRKIQGKDIGVVFQEPMSAMDPLMIIGHQVEEVLRIHTDLSREERRSRALEALAAVELPDPEGVYRKYPHELSGGMLQRAMIAAAIVARPRLLLLDEPTTALDVTIQAQILELLKKLNRESGISMLFISHNLNVVRKLCTRTAVMQRGVLVEEGDIETVFHHPQDPYTQRLIAAIPTRHRKGETP